MPVPLNLLVNEYQGVPVTPVECPKPETERLGGGQGPHLGLRTPWYNDLSHEVTDSTSFRILIIIISLDWIAKKLGWWN